MNEPDSLPPQPQLPLYDKNLRACRTCGRILTIEQFMSEGCDNCDDSVAFHGERLGRRGCYVHTRAEVEEMTTGNFNGFFGVVDSRMSWAARCMGVSGRPCGIYAMHIPEVETAEQAADFPLDDYGENIKDNNDAENTDNNAEMQFFNGNDEQRKDQLSHDSELVDTNFADMLNFQSRPENLYQLLDVSPAVDDKALLRLRRQLALKHHPDRQSENPHSPAASAAADTFAHMYSAVEMLLDPEKREAHDTLLGLNLSRRAERIIARMQEKPTEKGVRTVRSNKCSVVIPPPVDSSQYGMGSDDDYDPFGEDETHRDTDIAELLKTSAASAVKLSDGSYTPDAITFKFTLDRSSLTVPWGLGLKCTPNERVVVTRVMHASPAERAGIQLPCGDLTTLQIVAVDGEKVTTPGTFVQFTREKFSCLVEVRQYDQPKD